jgi:hypothetical protein
VVPLETQFGLFTAHLALREKTSGVSSNLDDFIPLVHLPVSKENS